ncbi:MAG: hypothetical protein Kow00121_65390 [Elainellaceae cyanobacterium]
MINRNSQTWTSRQFLSLGQNLARPYGVELEQDNHQADDRWTTQRLINMSNAFSRAYNSGW